MWIKIRRFTPKIAERGNRTVLAAHADMPHSAAGLVSDAEPDHLVVAPQSPVEKHQLASGQPLASRSVIAAQPGMKKKDFPVSRVDDLKTHRIALFCNSRILPGCFEIERDLRWHRKRDDRYSRRTRSPRELDPPIERQFDALDAIRSEAHQKSGSPR